MPTPTAPTPPSSQSLGFARELAITPEECALRLTRLRALLREKLPDAGGILLAGKVNIAWLAGTYAAGLLWVPLEQEPVLMVRKGRERALLESPLPHVCAFKSYREIAPLAAEAGSPLADTVAVDKNSFSWTMQEMLTSRLAGVRFVGGDAVLARARAVKTPFEQVCLRLCGAIHAHVMDNVLPDRFRALLAGAKDAQGPSEADLAGLYAEEVLRAGSGGLCRMNAHGEEMFYGYASLGNNGLYPTAYNGPLGCQGMDAATPFFGSHTRFWQANELLAMDMGCQKAGYHTDRTQVYWSGKACALPEELVRAQAICAEILDSTLDRLKPGTTPAELWANACALAKKHDIRDNFMGLGPDQVPFLGHGIGLCLDEWPALARSFNEPLEAGMVLALEPKIALPGLGMTGIEHTYLVTESGPQVLTGGRTDICCLDD